MARIYFDPDKDELVSTRKLTPKERAAFQRMLDEDAGESDVDSQGSQAGRISEESMRRRAAIDEETLRKMEDLEDAIRENTLAIEMNGMAEQNRHAQSVDSAATIAGGIIGFTLASGFIDSVIDTLNPFSGGCGCKKKKWF